MLNSDVDVVTSINFKGNIVDSTLYKIVVRKTGTGREVVDLPAIAILSEIIWWYRAREVRDPATGEVKLVKKFRGNELQIGYREFMQKFGLNKSQVQRALDLLRELGIIETHLRPVEAKTGTMSRSVEFGRFMFIRLVGKRLKELIEAQRRQMMTDDSYEVSQNSDIGLPKIGDPHAKNSIPPSENSDISYRVKERVEERVEKRDIERPALRPRPPGGEPANGDNGKAKDPKTEEARLLVDQLNELLHGGRLRALDKLRQKARARLRRFTRDEILEAARKCKADPFMNGQNDSRKVYATAEYILRNDLNVEKWLHAIERKRSPFDFGDEAVNPAFTFGGY